MRNKANTKFYETIENLSRQWWFYLIIVLCIFIPPYTPQGFSPFGELADLVSYVADYVIEKRLLLEPFMPVFHAVFLLLFYLLFKYENKFGRIFSIVAGMQFLLITYLQGGAATNRHGLVLYTNVIMMFSLIAFCWFWDAIIRKTDYTLRAKASKYFLMAAVVGVFSFWNPDTMGNLNPAFLVTSTSPIAFCMTTPIYLVALSLFYPNVNLPLFRFTSFIGILVSIITIGMGFFMENRFEGIYWSLLHSPMLITTVYCFALGFQKQTATTEVEEKRTKTFDFELSS